MPGEFDSRKDSHSTELFLPADGETLFKSQSSKNVNEIDFCALLLLHQQQSNKSFQEKLIHTIHTIQ